MTHRGPFQPRTFCDSVKGRGEILNDRSRIPLGKGTARASSSQHVQQVLVSPARRCAREEGCAGTVPVR